MDKKRDLSVVGNTGKQDTAETRIYESRPPLVVHEGKPRKSKSMFGRVVGSLVTRRSGETDSGPLTPRLELVKKVQTSLLVQTRGEALYTFARRRSESAPNFQNHTRDLTYRLKGLGAHPWHEVTISTTDTNGTDTLKTMRISSISEGSQAPQLTCLIEFDGNNQPVVLIPGEGGTLFSSLNPSEEISLALNYAERGAKEMGS